MPNDIDRNKEINANVNLIEQTLVAFGFMTRITEVNEFKNYIQFCLEIAVGTNLDDILKHDKDIALMLASPTGKVEIVAPIPGTSLIGINLPKNKGESTSEKGNLLYKNPFKSPPLKPREESKSLRQEIGIFFYNISYLLAKVGDKIIGQQKE